jgi:hypothetical protein
MICSVGDLLHLLILLFRAIDKLEGKVIIMRLLENPDSNVRYQGLLCVQKLMVHNW